MKCAILLFILLCLPWAASGMEITLNVDPALILVPSAGEHDFSTIGFNGLTLAGQAVSADLVFANNILARTFAVNPNPLAIDFLLIIQTNAPVFSGFPTNVSGAVLAADHTAVPVPTLLGGAMSDDGRFGVGVFPDFSGLSPRIVDLSGVHFDMTLPATGFTITDALLRIAVLPESYMVFGTARQLPEVSTLALLATGLGALAMLRYRRTVLAAPRADK
jgi:hypothetical protein